ncbi:MAG: aminoacyl-tRNA hydrolase [Planctomycetes bacterium]|nr:aminoacyl-tRNA hydrolase [Planctomycetota bacterium]
MKLIVGLGNPGRKYEKTRHNVGFEVLDLVAIRNAAGTAKEKFNGRIAEATITGRKTLLLWPMTLMNLSGQSVGPAAEFYDVPLADVLVIGDDFNLPLGKLRFRSQGSAGGQKGLGDIIRRSGSQEVPRLRVGIGPVPEAWDGADFVLGKFNRSERTVIDDVIARAAEAVECWVADGIETGMSRFN